MVCLKLILMTINTQPLTAMFIQEFDSKIALLICNYFPINNSRLVHTIK